jgi:hypothetical protein
MENKYIEPKEIQAPQIDVKESNIPDLGIFHEGERIFHQTHEAFPDDAGVRGLCKHLGISIGDVF